MVVRLLKMLKFITILCVCFVCVIVIVLTNAQIQEIETKTAQKIEEHLYQKCYTKTRNLLPYEVLYNDTKEFLTQMNSVAQLLPDQKIAFCEIERKHLVTKIEKVSKDLRNCLVAQEQYLSDFLENVVKESLHFLCHNHGENIDELFSPKGKKCVENLEKDQTNELDNCFSKIFPPVSDIYVTKKEVCDGMNVAKKCINNMLDQTCSHTKSMHELSEKYFKYVGRTCSGCVTNYLSTLLLIVSIVLSFTFKH